MAGAAAAGAIVGATVASGTARSNPGGIPYAPDAYVNTDAGPAATPPPAATTPPPPPPTTPPPPPEDESTSPMVWIAGIIAVALLALVAFFVFQLASGGNKTPVEQVTVPNLVGLASTAASQQATSLGLTLTPTGVASSAQPEGTILTQDPPAGTKVDTGTAIKVTVATGPGTVPVPDLRLKDESSALQALSDAGLRVGIRTEEFDPTVPAGQVARQNPSAGIVVAKGTAVDYVMSKGPEPSPSPTPDTDAHADTDADPHADADADARTRRRRPTPTPTPAPTPTPRPRRRPRRPDA